MVVGSEFQHSPPMLKDSHHHICSQLVYVLCVILQPYHQPTLTQRAGGRNHALSAVETPTAAIKSSFGTEIHIYVLIMAFWRSSGRLSETVSQSVLGNYAPLSALHKRLVDTSLENCLGQEPGLDGIVQAEGPASLWCHPTPPALVDPRNSAVHRAFDEWSRQSDLALLPVVLPLDLVSAGRWRGSLCGGWPSIPPFKILSAKHIVSQCAAENTQKPRIGQCSRACSQPAHTV